MNIRRVMFALIVAGLVFIVSGSIASVTVAAPIGETGVGDNSDTTWDEIASSGPLDPRAGFALAVDDINETLFVYGGTCAGHACNDTWKYDGQGWFPVPGSGPTTPREETLMAFDSNRSRFVLFGGHIWADGLLNDTWEFDGSNWEEKHPQNTPPARANYAIAYDKARKRTVMYGGWGPSSGEEFLGDTWEFDGTDWHPLPPGGETPGLRAGARMVYDESLQRIVLFGGYYRNASDQNVFPSDIWQFDGNAWSPLPVGDGPPGRFDHYFAYDPIRQVIVLFGGLSSSLVALNDTWEFDGMSWQEIQPDISPPASWVGHMAYFAPKNGILLFGGNSPNQNDLKNWLWLYGGGKTLPEKAIELAQSAVGAPYQWGGKGWDLIDRRYVESVEIQSGYNFWNPRAGEMGNTEWGEGLDCSGLVQWSYNKAFGAKGFLRTQGENNPVFYEGAAGISQHNSVPVLEQELQPGDLLLFGIRNGIEGDEHIAMYVGTYPQGNVIHSTGSEVQWDTVDNLKEWSTFDGDYNGFRRLDAPDIDFSVRVYSPVDLVVTDPDGNTITVDTRIVTIEETLREVADTLYYSEHDINGDGDLDAEVYSPHLKVGDYLIRVVPKPDALPTDTYSLEIEAAGATLTLAQHVPIGDMTSREYTIRSTGDVIVHVNVAPVVDTIIASAEPVEVGIPIHINASFSDQDMDDTHVAQWDWGDGTTSPGTVTEIGGSGSVADSHTYTAPGIYTVNLTVADDDGALGESVFQYIVVYDPNGGFVTGGGWIDVPVGTYAPDPNLKGRTSFGFVSRYKRSALAPIGITGIRFNRWTLNLRSDEYDWMIIASPTAIFQGSGTINGKGDYRFIVTAVDARFSDDVGEDRLRFQIWDEVSGDNIFDTDSALETGMIPTTALTFGNIALHRLPKVGASIATDDDEIIVIGNPPTDLLSRLTGATDNSEQTSMFLPMVNR